MMMNLVFPVGGARYLSKSRMHAWRQSTLPGAGVPVLNECVG